MPSTGGRPLIEIDPARVEALAAQGLNEEQIARALGINWKTLAHRKKKFAVFSEALKTGKAKGLAKVTNDLFQQSAAGNTAATIFYLKNRDPENWSDKRITEYKGDPLTVVTGGPGGAGPDSKA